MDTGIAFPDEGDVVFDEARRYRALPPAARMAYVRELLDTGVFLVKASGKAEFVKRDTAEERAARTAAIREFIASHVT